jgi:ankyrin repeat protein
MLAALLGAVTMAQAQPANDLLEAATRGDASAVRRLLAAGAPVNATDSSGRTPLLNAVQSGSTETAFALIDAGADINAQAGNQDTPWLLAGALGHAGMLRAMIPKDPDFSIRNRYGGNALIPACERAHVDAVKVLLTTKINLDHLNNLGWTCLLEIVVLGDGGPRHVEVTKLVLDAGASPNIADKDRVTPLTHAKRKGQQAVARLIEAAGGR